MKEILNKYKERLINISRDNRSLCIKKLYKKRAFDIYNLKEFDYLICKDIINFLNNSSKKEIKILDDYTLVNAKEMKRLRKEYEEALNKIEKFKEEKDLERYKKEKEKIDKKFKEEDERVKRKIKKMQDYSSSLNNLNKEYISLEKETGKRVK